MALNLQFTFKPRKGSFLTVPLCLADAGDISYFMPALIGDNDLLGQVDKSQATLFAIECMSLLTLRLSQAHHYNKNLRTLPFECSNDGAEIYEIYRSFRRRLPIDVTAEALIDWGRLIGELAPEIRQNLTWVGGRHHRVAWLVPPPTSSIPALLVDLQRFLLRNENSNAIAKAEALLYQFVHIHPLADGNGRVARSLLVKLGVTHENIDVFALVWMNVFRKLSVGAAWRADPDQVDDADFNYRRVWVQCVQPVLRYFESTENTGYDEHCRRAIHVYIACGRVSADTLISITKCSAGSARKTIEKLSESLQWIADSKGELANEKLDKLFASSIEKFVMETEKTKVDI